MSSNNDSRDVVLSLNLLSKFAPKKKMTMANEKKIIIAVDGYASCGKSTMSKAIAKILKYKYVDTGAMYRAVTLFALRNGYIESNGELQISKLVSSLDKISITFVFNADSGKSDTYLNGENVEDTIRTLEVSNFVSPVAAIKEVRQAMVLQQQQMGKEKGIVMDGRDIGTVVFPYAELKIFMTASSQVRAKRRFDELTAKGESVSFDEILANVEKRDYIDETRAESPLRRADDAIILDNSYMNQEEQLAWVIDKVERLKA